MEAVEGKEKKKSFCEQIHDARIAYRSNFGNEASALIVDSSMISLLIQELAELGDERAFSLSTYRNLKVVVINDQHGGQCSWGLGIWGA
jgi:hypothetical protein